MVMFTVYFMHMLIVILANAHQTWFNESELRKVIEQVTVEFENSSKANLELTAQKLKTYFVLCSCVLITAKRL